MTLSHTPLPPREICVTDSDGFSEVDDNESLIDILDPASPLSL